MEGAIVLFDIMECWNRKESDIWIWKSPKMSGIEKSPVQELDKKIVAGTSTY